MLAFAGPSVTSKVTVVSARVYSCACHRGERGSGQVRDRPIAVGEQVKLCVEDVGEHRGWPAAPVEADRHPPFFPHALAQLRERSARSTPMHNIRSVRCPPGWVTVTATQRKGS
jgi:hypothetical protein